MPTNPSSVESSQAQHLRQMESSIEELNARIARLAIGLGVSLKNDDELARVMSYHTAPPVSQERRTASDGSNTSGTGSDSERRIAHKWDELRGLLVLRYGIETRYVNQVGVAVTQQLMTEAEANLLRNGFEPGADGIDLNRLFFRA